MSVLVARALLWGQRGGLAARTSISPLVTSFRLFSSSTDDDEIAKARKRAELQKIEVDAAAYVEKVKADVAAHADKAKIEVDKVKAEAEKAKVDAAAHADKVKAEAGSAWDSWWAQRIKRFMSIGTFVLGAGYLAYDEITHSKAFVRWNMKRVIRAGPPDILLPDAVPAERRFVLREPRVVEGFPHLILGPSGTGKSSLMADMVRELKKNKTPVVYFSTRSSYEQNQGGKPLTGINALEVAARKFCEAVGYPESSSFSSRWKTKEGTVSWPWSMQAVFVPKPNDIFYSAIDALFDVCAELRRETGKVPYVIIDEFHDFMNENLRSAGGDNLFNFLADKLITFGTDRGNVQFVAGTSGSEILSDLEKYTNASNFRMRPFYTEDPSTEAVRARLKTLGYSDDAARRILATCGTRLRVLKPFLVQDSAMSDADVEHELVEVRSLAKGYLDSFIKRADEAGVKREAEAILDKLDKGRAVELQEIPPALQSPFPNKVFFWARGNMMVFQSVPVSEAWKERRGNRM